MGGRENFDNAYATLIERRKRSSEKDAMNVLYVALTRAVEGMIVLKKPKKSIFDALGMETMSLGTLSVHRSVMRIQKEESQTSSVVISHYGTQEVPSVEEEEEKDYEAILFGTALHYTLEMLSAFDEDGLALAMIALKNRYGQLLSPTSISEIEARIVKLIENSSFQERLVGAKITKEQSLSFEGELKQIDLLLEYDDHCVVVDYKSSKKYMLKHEKQVKHYQKAIEAITGKRTEGMVIYLLEEKIETSILN
jgi:exodeoxyribonuclease V beta subunit